MVVPLDKLREASGRAAAAAAPRPAEAPIDTTLPFVCPTVVPLHYTRSARRLSPEQSLRANQLNALYFVEVISFFETAVAPLALAAMARECGEGPLADCLRAFREEEARHAAMFRRLARRSAPGWYDATPYRFLALPPGVRLAGALVPRVAAAFPVLAWLMLAVEEHSVLVSRRCGAMGERLEPQWAATWRAHLDDEVRHVQIDLHLLERFHAPRPAWRRRAAAAVVRFVLSRLLLAPRRSAERVLAQLVAEFPELRPAAPELRAELRALGSSSAYRAMMYSRRTTPLTFAAFDRHPEFHAAARALAPAETE